VSIPALGPIKPIQRLPGATSQGVKRPGREADHPPPSSKEVKNSDAIPPLFHRPSWHNASLIKHKEKVTFFHTLKSLLMLQTCTREVPGSNLYRDADDSNPNLSFSSISLGKCRVRTFNYTTTASFHIHFINYSLSINHVELYTPNYW
jgi:hypothetical protein